MIKLWTPLEVLREEKKSIIFDEACNRYNPEIKSFRPFVIFYNEKENSYYYLRARRAYGKDKNTKKPYLKRKNSEEVTIKPIKGSKILYKDSYVDCSQIFKMDKESLESILDPICFEKQNQQTIANEDIQKIKNKLKECIMQVPPNLSIIEVSLDKQTNQTKAKSLYLCNDKVDWLIDENDYGLGQHPIEFFNKFKSDKNGSEDERNRFIDGAYICLQIINEYFPECYNRFWKDQELDKVLDVDYEEDQDFSKHKSKPDKDEFERE